MNWSRRHKLPPGLRHLPPDDRPPSPERLLTQPWRAGVTGWVVIFVAILAELAGGAAVANQTSAAVAVPVLLVPAAVALGFGVVQWWQVRSSGAEPASWWHLGGTAAAALTWVLWPTVPGALAGNGVSSGTEDGRVYCDVLPRAILPGCLHRAAQAYDYHYLAWWSTGAVILLTALLVRRSRIAAYAAIPVAFAGAQLAAFFLNQFVVYYHFNG